MRRTNENGEVVIEASLIVTIVVIFISIMFYVGMILYQQSLVSIMANQTASNLAQAYANNLKDPFTGYVDEGNIYQSTTYLSMKNDAYVEVINKKSNVFAQYRLKSSRILTTGTSDVDVDLVKKRNEILKSQLVVTIHDKYDLPLVGMFNVNDSLTFTSTGRADCVDILEYLNGVEAIGDPENANIIPVSNTCTITFYAKESDSSVYATTTVLKGKSILSSNKYTRSTMPKDPNNGNVKFAGWYDEDGVRFTASTEVKKNMVLHGVWKCTVTLNADGGTVNGASVYTFEVNEGSRTVLMDAVCNLYYFHGWFTQRNGAGNRYLTNDTPIFENITLYANWEKIRYTVEFDPNGGELTYGVPRVMTVDPNTELNVSEPKYLGHIFEGWFTDDGTQYSNGSRVNSNIVLRARYTTCTNHRPGTCGVVHYLSSPYDFNWHSGHDTNQYFKTEAVSCLICVDCGIPLDGHNNPHSDQSFRIRYGSYEPIACGVWCARHYTSDRHTDSVRDPHIVSDSNHGIFPVH